MNYISTKVDDCKLNLNKKLENALGSAISIVQKDYLEILTNLEIVEPSQEDLDIDITHCGKFYKLSKLVLNNKENFLDKLITITNIACSVDGTLTTIIKSDGNSSEYYIGIISKNARVDNMRNKMIRQASAIAFSGAIEGNFAGSTLEKLEYESIGVLKEKLFNNANSVAAVSGIVGLRNKNDRQLNSYVQGIENLTDSLKGKQYTIMVLADPIGGIEMQEIKQGYEMIYSEMSMFETNVITMNESDSMTLSNSKTNGITKGLTEGISKTQSYGTTNSFSNSKNWGVNITPIGIGVTSGTSKSYSSGTTSGESYGSSTSSTNQKTNQTTKSDATTIGSGKSIQLTSHNRVIKGLLDRIDLYIKRLEECESFGAFSCCTYVLTEKEEDSLAVASNYNALMRGEESFIQTSKINCWNKSRWNRDDNVEVILKYLKCFTHPRFYMDEDRGIKVTPASVISGKELAIQFGFPKKSIIGLDVIEKVEFGRNVKFSSEQNIDIGNLYHMGKNQDERVRLDLQSIASHVFITGSTGAGKSNTIYKIISELQNNQVKFMVIEPAKGEYKHIFGNNTNVKVYGTNNKVNELLRLNPFKFPDKIHVLEHIDRLIEIFNVCWPMYAAMPAVLKESVEKAYELCGWNLSTSENEIGRTLYPTFKDLLETLIQVIESSAYSEEMKSNYKGSLLTRVKSLTNGLNGQMFSGIEITDKELFGENIIVDLSRVGSMETKSMIMGMLIMRLSEYKIATGGVNSPLKHVTILEEAHNLLKKTSTEQGSETSNLIGKSVEMLTNAIAEMRTYGEGFIIADQSPGLLDLSVIRNTNTKIILRVPEHSDRMLVGKAAAMTDEQVDEISRLEIGVGAIYQNNWLEPILCKIDHYKVEDKKYIYTNKATQDDSKIYYLEFVKFLLKERINHEINIDVEMLQKGLETIDLSTKTRIKLHTLIGEFKLTNKLYIWEVSNFGILAKLVSDLLALDDKVKYIVKNLTHIEQFNQELTPIIQSKLKEVSNDLIDEIIHCVIKDISYQNEENLKLYHLWYKDMKKKMI